MGVGGGYLATKIAYVFVPMVRTYGDCVRNHFLPAFVNLDEKAREVADRAYSELVAQPAGPDDGDPGGVADEASARGQDFYDFMFAMRQSSLNIWAAGLYHLLEQQLAALGEDATFQAMGVPVPEAGPEKLVEWYRKYLGVDLAAFAEWPKIGNELRLIANAVKHGEGRSAQQVRKLRPDLFTDPRLARLGLGDLANTPRRLSMPLAGEGLFITPEILEEYTRSGVSLLEALQEHFLMHQDQQYPVVAQ